MILQSLMSDFFVNITLRMEVAITHIITALNNYHKNSSKNVKGVLAVYNLGQEVIDKFTKLSNIGFPMKCFIADFLQFFTVKRQNLSVGWTGRYLLSNPSISGIFLKLPNFLRS